MSKEILIETSAVSLFSFSFILIISFVFSCLLGKVIKMNKRSLKLYAVPAIYIVTLFTVTIIAIFLGKIISNHRFKSNEEMEYVDKEIVTDNEYIPVVSMPITIMKPFLIDNITINKIFFKERKII